MKWKIFTHNKVLVFYRKKNAALLIGSTKTLFHYDTFFLFNAPQQEEVKYIRFTNVHVPAIIKWGIMNFLFSFFGIAFLLTMLWSYIFSQSLYDDGNRNYEEINRKSKLVVIKHIHDQKGSKWYVEYLFKLKYMYYQQLSLICLDL